MASKEQVIKEKAGNWDFIRIKNLGAANDAIKKVKNKPQNGRKDVKIIYLTSNLHGPAWTSNIQSMTIPPGTRRSHQNIRTLTIQ